MTQEARVWPKLKRALCVKSVVSRALNTSTVHFILYKLWNRNLSCRYIFIDIIDTQICLFTKLCECKPWDMATKGALSASNLSLMVALLGHPSCLCIWEEGSTGFMQWPLLVWWGLRASLLFPSALPPPHSATVSLLWYQVYGLGTLTFTYWRGPPAVFLPFALGHLFQEHRKRNSVGCIALTSAWSAPLLKALF